MDRELVKGAADKAKGEIKDAAGVVLDTVWRRRVEVGDNVAGAKEFEDLGKR